MHAFLAEVLSGLGRIPAGKPILVGFSGGADSVCLLHTLHEAGFPLIAAHYNHQLRPGASREAEFAAHFSNSLGIPMRLGSGDVQAYARKWGFSVESAARRLRYQFLFAEATRQGAAAVAVAHHADDQAETVLLHIMRGAGGVGLQGMAPYSLPNPWSQDIPLLRPLLSFWKTELLAYCAENQLAFQEDESNQDQAFRRNAIRHTLLPMLASYNPQIRQALWRLSQIARDEQAVLASAAEEAWQACLQTDLHRRGGASVVLDRKKLSSFAPALQRMVLRRAVGCLRPGLGDVDFAAVERARAAMQQGRAGAQVDLTGGLRLEILGTALRLVTWDGLPEADWPQVSAARAVNPGEPSQLGETWEFHSRPVPATAVLRQAILANGDPFQAWVDLDTFSGALQLRPRWPGARFQPLGMTEGTQKISDLMINQKIPRPARAAWPLLCAGEQVIWVPGLMIGHPYRVTETTRQALHLILKMKEQPETGD